MTQRYKVQSSDKLTPREQQVYDCLLDCKGNKEIASELHISVYGVIFHVRNILHKRKLTCRWEVFRGYKDRVRECEKRITRLERLSDQVQI